MLMSPNTGEVAGHSTAEVFTGAARPGSVRRLRVAAAPVALLTAVVAFAAGLFSGVHSNVVYVEFIGRVDCGSALTDAAV